MVCLAESEADLQNWRLEVNLTKTNIVHVRNPRKPQSKFMFLFDMRPVPYCKFYKYLGTNLNEFLDKFTVDNMQRQLAGHLRQL